jgi:hypothetical protein
VDDFLALLLCTFARAILVAIEGGKSFFDNARNILLIGIACRGAVAVAFNMRSSPSGASSDLPRVTITARSMKFSSSRMLPGQSHDASPGYRYSASLRWRDRDGLETGGPICAAG